jgi:2,3-bisphosphoglycerate-dependent phosphoglycerate mutase
MQLVFVRHALPERIHSGADDQPGGPADPQLTELGQRQARRVVEALAGEDVAGLYSSPMARARGTAAPLAAALGREPKLLPGLAEYDVDSPHYVPVHEMPRLDPAGWRRLLAGLLPESINVDAFRERVVAAVEGVAGAHAGRETAVLVAHAGVVNVYLAHVLEIPRPLAFPLDYAGITRVIAGRDGRRLVRTVNEIGHVADLLDVG